MPIAIISRIVYNVSKEQVKCIFVVKGGDDKMLLGKYKHTIDAKNRVFIPAKFRTELGERFIIARDIADNCLNLYSLEQWTIFEQKINELPGIQMRRIKQFIYFGADEVTLDSMGRIVIPGELCKEMSMEGEVAIIGMSSFAQIWKQGDWEKQSAGLNEAESRESIINELIDIGF